MPRISLIIRAARRAALAFSIFPKTRTSSGGHFPSPSLTCPYCSKTLGSREARDRHIITKPFCHEQHLNAPDERPAKQPRTLDTPIETATTQPGAGGSANAPDKQPPDMGGDERICGERAYLDSCGNLGNPELFNTAELLMTTVPKSHDRTKHLPNSQVQGKNSLEEQSRAG